jgi:N-carbamoylputrescine amidase
MTFAGESFVCDPFGRVVARGPAAAEAIVYADLDLAQLPSCHARQLFLRDRRPELVTSLLSLEKVEPGCRVSACRPAPSP